MKITMRKDENNLELLSPAKEEDQGARLRRINLKMFEVTIRALVQQNMLLLEQLSALTAEVPASVVAASVNTSEGVISVLGQQNVILLEQVVILRRELSWCLDESLIA
jgi:hypothetical protein